MTRQQKEGQQNSAINTISERDAYGRSIWNRASQNDRNYEEWRLSRDTEPIVIIPEENIQIHSRSMIIRLDSAGVTENLRNDDFEKAKVYLHRMSHNDKFQNMKE